VESGWNTDLIFMDAYDLNTFSHAKRKRTLRSGFVPQLTIGSQPLGLGSVLAPVVGATVSANAVPFVEGGYPHPLAPPSNPGTQNQRYQDTANAKPPWISVPACRLGARPPKAQPLGLQTPGIHSLNLNAPKSVLTLTTY
jgi:hypothetical protein